MRRPSTSCHRLTGGTGRTSPHVSALSSVSRRAAIPSELTPRRVGTSRTATSHGRAPSPMTTAKRRPEPRADTVRSGDGVLACGQLVDPAIRATDTPQLVRPIDGCPEDERAAIRRPGDARFGDAREVGVEGRAELPATARGEVLARLLGASTGRARGRCADALPAGNRWPTAAMVLPSGLHVGCPNARSPRPPVTRVTGPPSASTR